eukprot:scaffold180217_cov34-Tisochrysis_lutea.AAC.1
MRSKWVRGDIDSQVVHICHVTECVIARAGRHAGNKWRPLICRRHRRMASARSSPIGKDRRSWRRMGE